jgi:histone arginine demethylase JMJD6
MVTQQTKFSPKKVDTIDKRSNLSRKELIREYIEPSIPVILTDAADEWGAMTKFTPEFFKKEYGHVTKTINGVTYTISEFIDRMLTSTPENPAPYPFSFNIETFFPELMKDIKPEIVYGKVDRVNHPLVPRFMMHGTEVYEVFLGGKGSSFPILHIDALYLHNQATMVYGSKDFILYSPDQTSLLYPKESNTKYSQINILEPDYDKFPLFKDAHAIKVNLKKGETLLFPTGWWHTTLLHEPCISVGRVQLNAANWNKYVKDQSNVWKDVRKSPFMANMVLAYGKMLGPIMNMQEKLSTLIN